MRRFLFIVLMFFALSSFAQKMTIKTCEIQYGDVLDYNLDDIVMDGEPCPYVTKFQLTDKYFIEITNKGNFKYNYGSEINFKIKASEDFRITIKDEGLTDYDVHYSYKEQNITFIYSDGAEGLRLTRFTIDNIKVK